VVRWSWAVCGWLSASWNVGTKGLRYSLGRWEGWGGRLLTQALSRLPQLMNSASCWRTIVSRMRVANIEGGKASMVPFASRRCKKGSSTYDILVANFSNIVSK